MRKRRSGFGTCDANLQQWYTDPPGFPFERPRLPFERPPPSTTLFGAKKSTVLNFDFNADTDLASQTIKLMRIRIRNLLINQPIKLTYWSYEIWALATQQKLEKISYKNWIFVFAGESVANRDPQWFRNKEIFKTRNMEIQYRYPGIKCEHYDGQVWIRIHIVLEC